MFGFGDTPLNVREGAHYLTRDGSVVGPAVFDPSSVSTGRNWRINGCHYYGNGTAFNRHDGWDLELVEEIPDSLMNSLISRREHDSKMRQAQARINDLEAALAAFAGLKKAMDVVASIKLRTDTAQQHEPSTATKQNETRTIAPDAPYLWREMMSDRIVPRRKRQEEWLREMMP